MSNQELKQYGVLGMKWGIHRTRNKQAKKNYERAKNEAFSEYKRDIAKVEKKYKRGQSLSKKDQAREAEIEARYQKKVASAKTNYKKAKKDRSKDADIANKLYSVQSEKVNNAVAKMSTGEAVVKSALMGSFGALTYTTMRSNEHSRMLSAGAAVVANTVDTALSKMPSTFLYVENVVKR